MRSGLQIAGFCILATPEGVEQGFTDADYMILSNWQKGFYFPTQRPLPGKELLTIWILLTHWGVLGAQLKRLHHLFIIILIVTKRHERRKTQDLPIVLQGASQH